jgi:hypothetical protein
VNAENAFIGNPPFMFFLYEFFYTILPDILQILDLAHAVARPVPVIQPL